MQLSLYIATNKRTKPTRLILDHLGWTSYFNDVYALDYLTVSKAQKSDLLKYIVDKYSMNSESTLYVGDRPEDGKAAAKNHLKFAFAAWGYGMDIKIFEGSGDFYLECPARLREHLDF